MFVEMSLVIDISVVADFLSWDPWKIRSWRNHTASPFTCSDNLCRRVKCEFRESWKVFRKVSGLYYNHINVSAPCDKISIQVGIVGGRLTSSELPPRRRRRRRRCPFGRRTLMLLFEICSHGSTSTREPRSIRKVEQAMNVMSWETQEVGPMRPMPSPESSRLLVELFDRNLLSRVSG